MLMCFYFVLFSLLLWSVVLVFVVVVVAAAAAARLEPQGEASCRLSVHPNRNSFVPPTKAKSFLLEKNLVCLRHVTPFFDYQRYQKKIEIFWR